MSSTLNLNLMDGLRTFDERFKEERNHRLKNAKNHCSFGVPFLDEALGGIYPNDVVILGAKSGQGKTQLSTLIALENAKLNKRVVYIALEAEESEIERRIKYRMIADRFFKLDDRIRPEIKLNYMDWYYGKLDYNLKEIEEHIEAEGPYFPTLKIFYRKNTFNVQNFEKLYFGLKDEADLFIVDHLHYFDIDDENENRAVKQIMLKIRDCALIASKPVLLVAHLRKSDRKNQALVPGIEDFHGSSDIGKVATKAILIARDFENTSATQSYTFFNIQKCRPDGQRLNAVGNLSFNFKTQAYDPRYLVGKLSQDGLEFQPYDFHTMPFWAKSGVPFQGGVA